MGWMKAIYTDVEQLNEAMLDIYSEHEIVTPGDALEPLSEYLTEAGWKSPTEMLALRQDVKAIMQRMIDSPDSHGVQVAYGDLALTTLNALGLGLSDLDLSKLVTA